MYEEINIYCYCGRTVTAKHKEYQVTKGVKCECGRFFERELIKSFVFANRAKYRVVNEAVEND
jgi:hypothetical protein